FGDRFLFRLSRFAAAVAQPAGALQPRCAVAFTLVALPPDVSLRRGEARQRRRSLAQPERTSLPPLTAASAYLDQVLRPAPTALPPGRLGSSDVRHRAAGAVSYLRSAPRALVCRRGDCLLPSGDCGDRQLRIFQPPCAATLLAAHR